jgi:hypothetical protein
MSIALFLYAGIGSLYWMQDAQKGYMRGDKKSRRFASAANETARG